MLFDKAGNLTTEAIHKFKNGQLSEADTNKVKQFLATSPMDAEAVAAYNPEEKDRFAKLNERISQKIDDRAGVVEQESGWHFNRIYALLGGLVVVGIIAVASYDLFLSDAEVASPSEEQVEDVSTNAEVNQVVETNHSNDNLPQENTTKPLAEEASSESNETATEEADQKVEESTEKVEESTSTNDEVVESTETEEKQEKVLNITFAINSEYVFLSDIDDKNTQPAEVSNSDIEQSEKKLMDYLKSNIEVTPDMLKGGSGSYGLALQKDGTLSGIKTLTTHSATVDNQMKLLLKQAPIQEFALQDGTLKYTIQVTF